MLRHNFDETISRRGTGCKKWDTYPEDILPMWIADTDFLCPQPVVEAMIKRARHGIYGYPANEKSFEQAIVGWQKNRFGWDVDLDSVEYTPAVAPAIIFALRAFTNPGDGIVIQVPSYPPFHDIISHNGRTLLGNQLILRNDGSYDLDFDHLESLFKKPRTRMFLLCSPHNPIGRCFSEKELRQMDELARKYNVFVVSDEIHSDIVYQGHRHIPFGSLSEETANNCVVCVNPSKTFNIAGVRSGAVIIPSRYNHDLFYTVVENNKAYGRTIFGTLPIEVAYNECSYYADQLVEYLTGNLRRVESFLTEQIPQIKLTPTSATYLLWLNCKDLGFAPKDLMAFFLEKAKVAMNEGSTFGSGGAGYMRLNIACPRSQLDAALERIARAVNAL